MIHILPLVTAVNTSVTGLTEIHSSEMLPSQLSWVTGVAVSSQPWDRCSITGFRAVGSTLNDSVKPKASATKTNLLSQQCPPMLRGHNTGEAGEEQLQQLMLETQQGICLRPVLPIPPFLLGVSKQKDIYCLSMYSLHYLK